MSALELVIARIDAANAADPNREADGQPKELVYGRRMSAWLAKLLPDASELLQIAVRAQHLERWRIPREAYAMDRDGYRAWRTELGRMHARRAGELMREVGYDEAAVARVEKLIRKEKLKVDPEGQALEDVACLVFLEHYLAAFVPKHDEAKLETILKKTWKKMSAAGHEAALGIPMATELRAFVVRAVTA